MIIAVCPDGTKLAFDDGTPQSTIDAAVRRYIDMCKRGTQQSSSPVVVQVPEIRIPDIKIPDLNVTFPDIPSIELEIPQPDNTKAFDSFEEISANISGLQTEISKLIVSIEAASESVNTNSRLLKAAIVSASEGIRRSMEMSSMRNVKVAEDILQTLRSKKVIKTDGNGNPTGIEVQ